VLGIPRRMMNIGGSGYIEVTQPVVGIWNMFHTNKLLLKVTKRHKL